MTITKQDWLGTPVYRIENDRFLAELCPSFGNNLMRFYDKGMQREVLRRPENPSQLQVHPGHFGTPLMLPPGRIQHGRFQYNDRTYQFNINSGTHHIHGFIRSRPWKMETYGEENGTSFIVSSFETTDDPELIRQYPHDLRIEVTYELRDNHLLHQAVICNRSDQPAPIGYGLHTWFALDGEPDKWTLRAPVSQNWELDSELIPTGRILPLGSYESLPTGMQLNGIDLDALFQASIGPNTAVLDRGDLELHYSAPEPFKQWVIYTMGQADQWICLEPCTWAPNAPNLDAPPEQTGLRAIAPGAKLQAEVVLEVIHK